MSEVTILSSSVYETQRAGLLLPFGQLTLVKTPEWPFFLNVASLLCHVLRMLATPLKRSKGPELCQGARAHSLQRYLIIIIFTDHIY